MKSILGRRAILGGAVAAAAAPIANRIGANHSGALQSYLLPSHPPPSMGVMNDKLPEDISSLFAKADHEEIQFYELPKINGFDLDIAAMRSWSSAAALVLQRKRDDARRSVISKLRAEGQEMVKKWQESLLGSILSKR